MKTKKTPNRGSYVNRYTLTIVAFMIWISCLDSQYSWIKQYKLTKQLMEMDDEKDTVVEKLAEAKVEYDELMTNKEKYAREKYFLSKPGEEVFIIK